MFLIQIVAHVGIEMILVHRILHMLILLLLPVTATRGHHARIEHAHLIFHVLKGEKLKSLISHSI